LTDLNCNKSDFEVNRFFLRRKQMTSRKGFTLIELMVVIFIVGILAAVAIPIMRGRIDAAKWSEGKASAGSVRTALRAYFAEKGEDYTGYAADIGAGIATFGPALGFAATDLDGKYFKGVDYHMSNVAVAGGDLTYTITIGPSTADEGPSTPLTMTLDQTGTFN
jgi:prepilin-type N-terminal cleavage/methylation domain-containing protein